MSLPKNQNLTIVQGTTYELPVRWETDPIVYKPITGITKAAPCVITCPSYGAPDGWRVVIVSSLGMTQINAANSPPRESDYVVSTKLTGDTLELNTVNSAGYSTYTSGGYVQYNTPQDLAGYLARMDIKDKIGGTVLLSLTTENSRIVLDNTTKTITLTISADDTAAITWKKGVYDLEMESSAGVVTALMYGTVTVTKEVTVNG